MVFPWGPLWGDLSENFRKPNGFPEVPFGGPHRKLEENMSVFLKSPFRGP